MRYLTDASFLFSVIRSCDSNHESCNSYFRDHEEALWVIPTIAYFEYQATQSRLKQEGKKAYREMYIRNFELRELTVDFVRRVADLDLASVFGKLKGADLVYACIAKIDDIPLVTCDSDFDDYKNEIVIINPTRA